LRITSICAALFINLLLITIRVWHTFLVFLLVILTLSIFGLKERLVLEEFLHVNSGIEVREITCWIWWLLFILFFIFFQYFLCLLLIFINRQWVLIIIIFFVLLILLFYRLFNIHALKVFTLDIHSHSLSSISVAKVSNHGFLLIVLEVKDGSRFILLSLSKMVH